MEDPILFFFKVLLHVGLGRYPTGIFGSCYVNRGCFRVYSRRLFLCFFFTPTGICRIHAFEAFIFFTYEMALYANEGRLYGV